MSNPPDDVDARPAYQAFLQRLAARPVLVIVTTFTLTAIVTLVVLIAEPDSVDIMGVVSLTATMWGLTLAVVIYLLTAQDTSRVLGQIGDLQEQLSAALAEPETETETTEPEAEADTAPLPDDEAPAVTSPRLPEPKPESERHPARPAKGGDGQRRSDTGPWGSREAMFYSADSGVALEDRVPSAYVEAWRSATGRQSDEVIRAWTRGRPDQAPWLLLCADGTRWSVYASGDSAPSVIQLSEPRGGRPQRSGDPRANRDRGQRGQRGTR